MGEFGHIGYCVDNVMIDHWGAGPFVISDGETSWRFEFSERFGPFLIYDDGEILEKQPRSSRHKFWKPFHAWLHQGKRLGADGITAIWHEPRPTKVKRLSSKSRSCIIVEQGDEFGEIEIVGVSTADELEVMIGKIRNRN